MITGQLYKKGSRGSMYDLISNEVQALKRQNKETRMKIKIRNKKETVTRRKGISRADSSFFCGFIRFLENGRIEKKTVSNLDASLASTRKYATTSTLHTFSPRLLASTKLNSSANRKSSSISSVDDDTLCRCCCCWNRTGGEILDGPAPAPAFLGAEPLALPAFDLEAFNGILHADDLGSNFGLLPPGVGDTDVGGDGVVTTAAARARSAVMLPVGLVLALAMGGKKWSSICSLVPLAANSSTSSWPASIGSSRYGGEIWIF